MSGISFFTAVKYNENHKKSFGESLLEAVDNYFYLGGKKAFVLDQRSKDGREKVVLLSDPNSSLLARIGKVFTYFTFIIPVLFLITKTLLRLTHSFKVISAKKKFENEIDLFKKASAKEKDTLISTKLEPKAGKAQLEVPKVIGSKKNSEINPIMLENNPDLSEEVANKIQALAPKILNLEKLEEIEYLKDSKVFILKEYPNIVFKMGIPTGDRSFVQGKYRDDKEIMDLRYENIIKAKEICLVNNLGLLVIPHVKKLNIKVENKDCTVIAEERMEINHEESAQEEFYHKYSKDLNETARQLAIFVAKSGFNDVTPRNIPLIEEAIDFQGPRRVALIDLEYMENSYNGFTGDDENESRGLLRCVAEDQIDIVIDEASKSGYNIHSNKEERLEEIEQFKKLTQFHESKGIVNGKELLQINLDSLGLDLAETTNIKVKVRDKNGKIIRKDGDFQHEEQVITLRKVAENIIAEINKFIHKNSDQETVIRKEGNCQYEEQVITLRKVTEDIINEINKLIQKNSDQESVKGKRNVYLDFNKLPDDIYRTWGKRIVQALIDKGHIFNFRMYGSNYIIQA